MKTKKITKQFKKMLILTGIYLVFAALVSISVISIINNSIVAHTTDSSILKSTNDTNNASTSTETKTTKDAVSGTKLTNIPEDSVNISFSNDEKYCVYLYNNEIFIKDIATDTIINKISDNASIANFILMNDRNIIIYFTIKDLSLNLRTFNIDNNTEILQKTINISSDTTIKQFDYSSLLNQIIINTESGKGGNLVSIVYRIDLLKGLHVLGIKSVINRMVFLNNTFSIYYEDKNNNLYCYPDPITGFEKKKIHLLGCDSNDDVFIQSLDNKNIVYVLKNKKIDKTINLSDPAYEEIYTNKIGVYLIYSNYILNLAGDINNKITFEKNLKFVGIGGNKIFFRDSNKNIIWENSGI